MCRRLALVCVCLAALACSGERVIRAIYACSEWNTELASGSWNDLEIGSARRTALRRLRELGFGEVRGLGGAVMQRAAPAESEDIALAGLARSAEWEAGRDRWWGHEAVTLQFEADRLRRIRIARVLFLD